MAGSSVKLNFGTMMLQTVRRQEKGSPHDCCRRVSGLWTGFPADPGQAFRWLAELPAHLAGDMKFHIRMCVDAIHTFNFVHLMP